MPQTRSEAGKFYILETESSNLGNTFRCNLIKVMKIKLHFLRAQPTQFVHYMDEFHWRAGMIEAIIHLVKHGRGYILQTPSINLHPWLSKQMPSVSEDVRAYCILSVRCNAGPAEGPGKILKYRSNLRLYPVNFGNKLCIWIFIILSI